jgi:hypothetical protein
MAHSSRNFLNEHLAEVNTLPVVLEADMSERPLAKPKQSGTECFSWKSILPNTHCGGGSREKPSGDTGHAIDGATDLVRDERSVDHIERRGHRESKSAWTNKCHSDRIMLDKATGDFLVRLSAALVFPGPPSAARSNQHVIQRADTPHEHRAVASRPHQAVLQ